VSISDYSYGGGRGDYDASYGGRDVSDPDSLGTTSSGSSEGRPRSRGWERAPLARLDSSSESVASAASTVMRGGGVATGGGEPRSASASIDSGVVMSSSLVVWPTGNKANIHDDTVDHVASNITDNAIVLRGEDDMAGSSYKNAPLDGAAGTLATCLDGSTAAMAAVALASLNENLSCLSAVTHIPDANCTVQVRRINDTVCFCSCFLHAPYCTVYQYRASALHSRQSGITFVALVDIDLIEPRNRSYVTGGHN
jgi:hypothetical protein